ncbi:MAG: YczE/YyaS/YitT family protein [Acidimicrobiia bacterium]
MKTAIDPLVVHRLVRLGLGLVLYGTSIALMLTAGLGVDSWDVLHQGLSLRTGVTFGWVVNGVSVAVLLLWVGLRLRPGFGTVANALVVGFAADAVLGVLATPRNIMGRLAVLVIGIVANGIATGLYIGAGLGPGPRDGLMTGLSARTGWSIRSVRTGIEITVLTAGWALGGPVGIGTVVYAVSIGALSQYFIARLSVQEAKPDRRRARTSRLAAVEGVESRA